MKSRAKIEQARLAVSRAASALFWEHGVEGTSGEMIAAASGLSKRTVWRYFRSKEATVEPLLLETELRFVGLLRNWPRNTSIEAYLEASMKAFTEDQMARRDGVASARIVALLAREPALRSAWLMACHQAEERLAEIIAGRLARSSEELAVKLCAASVMAAMRTIDEEIASAAILHGRHFELAEVTAQLSAAIRAASTLAICDPIEG